VFPEGPRRIAGPDDPLRLPGIPAASIAGVAKTEYRSCLIFSKQAGKA
jgi:hypothetical protein